jgi:hypothetical protein
MNARHLALAPSRGALLAAAALTGLSASGCECAWGGPSDDPANLREDSAAIRLRAGANLLPKVPPPQRTALTDEFVYNAEATIPPQCYTKTEGRHNPCYTCHQTYPLSPPRLNQMNDGGNQGDYSFSDVGLENHWLNLFSDKSRYVKQISDSAIIRYVEQDNYSSLAVRLKLQGYRGYLPDLKRYAEGAAAFDGRGLALDGSAWVAFTYKPFLGTFWPTNGSADDVLIRLPRAFRDKEGKFDFDVYAVNIALAELALNGEPNVPLWDLDEAKLGVDLDQDGKLGVAQKVVRPRHYIGDAKNIELEAEQLPSGTEFLHSVRYLRTRRGQVTGAPRMKELRYMRKVSVVTADRARSHYARERKEKLDGALPNFLYLGDEGYDNGLGWYVSGFIEDYDGELRPQTREEGLFCMGCHSALGTTLDSTFSFARKVPGRAGFGYIHLDGMRDVPSRSGGEGEILEYLARAGGGSEFRENPEMLTRWFTPDGTVDRAKVMAATVLELITPSVGRALELNKAYSYIVRHQSYRLGRDAHVKAAENVFRLIDSEAVPLEEEFRTQGWDIRLKWD